MSRFGLMSAVPTEAERGLGSSEARVSCQLLYIGPGNQLKVFVKSGLHALFFFFLR